MSRRESKECSHFMVKLFKEIRVADLLCPLADVLEVEVGRDLLIE